MKWIIFPSNILRAAKSCETQMKKANEKIADFMKKQPNAEFIDITKVMQDENGNVRKDLFVEDMLHMTPEGYRLWTSVMNPYMK